MSVDQVNEESESKIASSSAVRPAGPASALVIAAADKAGMEGIDRTKIDEIILRESGNSSYMKQQRKRDEQVNQRIATMLKLLGEKNRSSSNWEPTIERELEKEIEEHISHRPTRSTCVVVDMDMFYMACELLTRPELNEKPCCVGQGMITTSNYVARKYGVRSAMAGFVGDKLVDELSDGKEKLIHVPHNFDLYTEKSRQVKLVLGEYDPNLKAYSLDEVYLDIGQYVLLRLEGKLHIDIIKILRDSNAVESEQAIDDESVATVDEPLSSFPPQVVEKATFCVVREMRQRVVEVTGGLTCSAGIAPNFMLAKIASDRNKPDGQLHVGPSHDEVLTFLHPLPTRKVGGVGRVTEKMLGALGINTVKHLFEKKAIVRFCFKPATAAFLLRASLGCSSHESHEKDEDEVGRKGISRELTFTSGRPWGEINDKLEEIARNLSSDMATRNLWAHTVTLKVKLQTFDVLSRAKTLARGVYIQRADDMVKIVTELLKEVREQFKGAVFSVRLLGVRCSNFQGDKERLDASQMNIKNFFTTDNVQETSKSRATSPGQIIRQAKVEVHAPQTIEHVSCPICGRAFDSSHNDKLNSHIDSCLNGPTVREVVKEQSTSARPSKRTRLTDFFAG